MKSNADRRRGEAKVLISRRAAAALFHEVRRWVDLGLERFGTPLESLVYPLSALLPAAQRTLYCPLDLVGIDAIEQIVIDDVAVPPDDVKAFSPSNCHFAAADMRGANARFNAEIDARLALRPRLGVHSKLHSHPFARGAFLSGGDLHYGVSSNDAQGWRERRGLSTAILHVVHPDDAPRPSVGPWTLCSEGAIAKGRRGHKTLWQLRSWASAPHVAGAPTSPSLPPGLTMRDLGAATIVRSHHRAIRASRRKAYWQTRRGAKWCDGQKAALRAAGISVSRNLLGRGWRRYIVSNRAKSVLIALPPDFPAASIRLIALERAWRNEFSPLELPRGVPASGRYSDYSLLSLARTLLGE